MDRIEFGMGAKRKDIVFLAIENDIEFNSVFGT
jgi:hypothetical protein